MSENKHSMNKWKIYHFIYRVIYVIIALYYISLLAVIHYYIIRTNKSLALPIAISLIQISLMFIICFSGFWKLTSQGVEVSLFLRGGALGSFWCWCNQNGMHFVLLAMGLCWLKSGHCGCPHWTSQLGVVWVYLALRNS